MKDLSEVLDKIPAAQLTPPAPTNHGDAAIAAASETSSLEFEERDVEAYLMQLMRQSHARQDIRQPLDFQMVFRFCCVGLAGGCLVVAGFIAWLYRPVNAMAQADAHRSMSEAVVAMSHEVAAAKPSNTHCPLIGTCKVEAKPQPALNPSSIPVRSTVIQSNPDQGVPDNLGIPIPVGTTQAPTPGEINKAKQFIHQWSVSGANSIAVRDHIFQIRNGKVHHPNFPHPAAFETAYATYYGVSQ